MELIGTDWWPNFNPDAVLHTVRDLVGSVADVVARDQGRRIWVFPHAGDAPVYIHMPELETDRCDVYTGFAFHTNLMAQREDDAGEWVAELLCEIAAGEVTEFFDFAEAPGRWRDCEREYGWSGVAWLREPSTEAQKLHAYTVPPWKEQPRRASQQ